MDLNLKKKYKKLCHSSSEINLTHLKPYKYNKHTSKGKIFISGLDEEFLQKYIKNQLLKKNSLKNKDSFSSKSTKLIETNYSLNKTMTNQKTMNNLNHLNLNIKNDYSNELNSKKRNETKEKKTKTFNKQIDVKNQLISTKNSTQNLFYTQKIKTLMNNYCELKENSKLKNCISANNIHKKNISYQKEYKTNDCKFTRIKSEKHLKKEKRKSIDKSNYSKDINVENINMNYSRYKQLLIDRCNILRFEVNKYKKEKLKLEKKLNSLMPSLKKKEYIQTLIIDIEYYKKIYKQYKKNCDEFTKEIINLKTKIQKIKNSL